MIGRETAPAPEAAVTRRPRVRRPLLVALLLAAVAGGAVVLRARPSVRPPAAPEPEAPGPNRVLWGAEEARAKKLPEWAEVDIAPPKNGDPRPPLTDAQVSRFIELSDHPNKWIQLRAVGWLSRATGPRRDEAVSRIAAKLKDPEMLMRAHALACLASAKATDRIPDILPLLDSPLRDDRSAARNALERLGHPAGGDGP